MKASSGFHSHWFILQTALLVVINFITSLLFVATAAVQYFPAGYPPKRYCTCYTPPFWSDAHTYVKSLMLLATRWVWEREEDSGRAQERYSSLFFSPRPRSSSPTLFFDRVHWPRVRTGYIVRSVIFFSLHWPFSLIFNDDNRYSHVDVYNYFLACNYFLAERMDQSTPR